MFCLVLLVSLLENLAFDWKRTGVAVERVPTSNLNVEEHSVAVDYVLTPNMNELTDTFS